MLAEWAYLRLYPTNDARLVALEPWLDHYNHNRPHSASNGQAPMAVLVSN
jgi:transposase InsO family protein